MYVINRTTSAAIMGCVLCRVQIRQLLNCLKLLYAIDIDSGRIGPSPRYCSYRGNLIEV
jgi:hypothetical protein